MALTELHTLQTFIYSSYFCSVHNSKFLFIRIISQHIRPKNPQCESWFVDTASLYSLQVVSGLCRKQ